MKTLAPRAAATLLLEAPLAPLEDPKKLSEEADKAVHAFFHEGQSRNTARTYKTALQYWGAWHALRYGAPIEGPVPPSAVIQFIVDHLEHQPGLAAPAVSPYTPSSHTTQHLLPLAIDRVLVDRKYKAQLGPWSIATVQTRLAALSKAHEHYIANHAHLNLGPQINPLRDPAVRQLIGAARRAYARRGRDPVRPVAATRSVMEALLATCADDLAGKRDRALLLFGWASGGRRRSEITEASFENVRRDGNGFVFELHRSKTNQSGRKDPKNFKPIQGAAAQALQAWIDELLRFRITEGKLFRRILNDRIVEPLEPWAVRDIVRRRAKLASQPLGRLSAHSLRSGFVTEAGKQNISLGETMAMTGHRSVQTVMGYYQSGELSTSRAARLMDSND
jgi:integrase